MKVIYFLPNAEEISADGVPPRTGDELYFKDFRKAHTEYQVILKEFDDVDHKKKILDTLNEATDFDISLMFKEKLITMIGDLYVP